MNKKSLIRLCTFLISDEQSKNRSVEVLQGIIDSVFIKNNNNLLSANELSQKIKREVGLQFSIDEIDNVVETDDFTIYRNNDESKYSISQRRYELISKDNKSLNDFYVDFLSDEGFSSPEEIKNHLEIFHKFVYFSMNNTLSIKELLDQSVKKIPIAYDEINELTDSERELINKFLNLDNTKKNDLLFKVITSGFEFFTLSGCDDNNLLEFFGLNDKSFYLDTNIIFRALGLNGSKRQQRILQFFDKCKETRQKILISAYSVQEFRNSLKFHSNKIEEYKEINSKVFSEYSFEEDFYKTYFQWKTQNQYLGIDSFITKINNEYIDLIEKYCIEIETKYLEDNPENQETIYHYGQSIEKTKREIKKGIIFYDFETPERSVFDAKNILYIEHVREKEAKKNIPINYLISADHYLIDWDRERPRKTPIVLLPSHWLAVLMKYSNRTSDDYKSFISFINLPGKSCSFNNDKLGAILEGIGRITQDEVMQEVILLQLIETKITKILTSKKKEKIIEQSTIEAKKIFDEELERLRKKQEESDEKLNNISTKVEKTANEIQINKNIIEEKSSKLVIYHEKLKKPIIQDKTREWRTLGYVSLIPIIVCSFFILGMFLFRDQKWNISWIIIEYINSQENEVLKNLCLPTLTLPFAGIGFFGTLAYKRLASKKDLQELIDKIDFEKEIELM